MKKSKISIIAIMTMAQIILPTLTTFINPVIGRSNENEIEYDFKIEEEELKNVTYSSAYLDWLELSDEEKENVIKPREEYIDLDELNYVGDSNTIPSSYNLKNYIDIKVENQGRNNDCWAYAGLNSIETNILLKTGVEYDFSEIHAEYLTSTLLGGSRTYDSGGNFQTLMQYTKGLLGPVLETEIPNQTYSQSEYSKLINAKPIVTVTESIEFPNIDKSNNYTEKEMEDFRNSVKSHIMTNGSVYAICYFSENSNYYNSSTNALSCLDTTINPNHGISIIGWDDNYSRYNFSDENRPTSNGAYIALNSYGSSFGDNGVFYISYEDVWIEYNISGVISTELFQDTYGPKVTISGYTNANNKISMAVSAIDIGGNSIDTKNLKYKWTNTTTEPSKESFITTFSNGETISKEYTTGENWYLWIYAVDNLGNYTITMDHEWDISKYENRKILAKLDEYGTLTIEGTGEMKDWYSTTSIPWYSEKNNIKKVVVKEGVTSIGQLAFYYTKNLAEISLPESMTSIGCNAFSCLESLKNITIPKNVNYIGERAFALCPNLENIKVDNQNQNYMSENGILYNMEQTELINYSAGKSNDTITIPNSVKKISDFAFAYSIKLQNITIPYEVTSIGTYAFAYCKNLNTVTIPQKSITIGENAFANCTNLKTIYCKKNSDVQTYAIVNKIAYQILEDSFEIKEVAGNKYLVNITPKTNMLEIIYEIGTQETVSVYKGTEKITNTNISAVTGMKVSVETDAQKIEYTVVVKGDVNGDGVANLTDILAINKHRLNKTSLQNEYQLAGDVTEDGKIDLSDILKINKYRLGKTSSL